MGRSRFERVALYWNLTALPGLVACAFAWGAALLVLFAGPARFANRVLAFALFAEGLAWFGGNGLIYSTTDPSTAFASQALNIYAGFMIWPSFLIFASTLPSPLGKPFAHRFVRAGLVAIAVFAAALYATNSHWWITGVQEMPYSRWESVLGPAFFANFVIGPVVFLYLLAVTLDAYRRALPGPSRKRMGHFALAFGVRDGLFIVMFSLVTFGIYPLASVWAFPIATILFVPLLVYGILRAQLFDIDLRIKWTIRRGTVVGILAVAFVIVAEIAQTWLSDAYGYAAGGLAAGALLLAIKPLDRVGERLADAAMPHVQPTSEYLSFRKLDVYRAALEGARADGEVTPREREMLRRLRESLAITEADALAMERDLAVAG